jgi:hypothetical protein
MAKVYDVITEQLQEFIRSQHMFFVATAPLNDLGRVNVSPKGLDSFCILSESRVAYLDMTGSGNETSAHLLENGRITFMFCAVDGPPMILRLYGQGRTVLPGDAEWDDLIARFPFFAGVRQIIVADIDRVQTSCGHGVPLYDYQGQRDTLLKWVDRKGEDALADYRRKNNVLSIDGLPTALGTREQES